jgi:ABC-2 type transport system permease protein
MSQSFSSPAGGSVGAADEGGTPPAPLRGAGMRSPSPYGGRLRPYLAVFAGRLQLTLQYRAAALAGFATQLWFGVIRVLIFVAFYAGGAAHAPMSLGNAITYTWLGQAFLAFLPWSADPEITEMVRSGAVAYERLRPVDTYGWWYARALAWSVARVLPRAALMVAFAGVAMPLFGLARWGLAPPPSLAAAGLFAISLLGVITLSAAITLIINVILVASMSDRGANALAGAVVNLFSGMVVPLAFFPDALRPWLRAQPFAGLVDIPFSIYFGALSGWSAAGAIALQFGWALGLVALGRWWLGAVMRRLQVQGG